MWSTFQSSHVMAKGVRYIKFQSLVFFEWPKTTLEMGTLNLNKNWIDNVMYNERMFHPGDFGVWLFEYTHINKRILTTWC